jgi:hypothetical protein
LACHAKIQSSPKSDHEDRGIMRGVQPATVFFFAPLLLSLFAPAKKVSKRKEKKAL